VLRSKTGPCDDPLTPAPSSRSHSLSTHHPFWNLLSSKILKGFAPNLLLASEDGCVLKEPDSIIEVAAPVVKPEVIALDQASCKRRRQDRIEVLQRKRLKLDTSSEASSISSVQFLTKEEIRRKKNRESAERSRLRKLARIDDLTLTACEMFVQLRDLTEMNCELRSAPRSTYQFVSRVLPPFLMSSTPASSISSSPTSSSSSSLAGIVECDYNSDDSSVSSITVHSRPRAHATAVSYGFDTLDDDCASNHGQDWGDFLATLDLDQFEFV